VLRNPVTESGRARPGIKQSLPHECEQILEFFVGQHGGIGNARIETMQGTSLVLLVMIDAAA
jgi:hypothetical protein